VLAEAEEQGVLADDEERERGHRQPDPGETKQSTEERPGRPASGPLGAEREPIDALGVATKAVEAVGLAAAIACLLAQRADRSRPSSRAYVRPGPVRPLTRSEENSTYEEVR
jgi:hypothetical protein